MKRFLFILAFPVVAFSQPFTFGDPVFVAGLNPTAGGQVFLINQTFEGTGYDNGESWSELGGGTIDEDYTATVLEGSQSLHLDASTADAIAVSPAFGAQSDFWFKAYFRFIAIPSATRMIVRFDDAADAELLRVQVQSTGELVLFGAGTDPVTVAQCSTGVTYAMWVHIVPGGGSNGVGSVAFSSSLSTKPTSGDNFAGRTDYTFTTGCDQVFLFADFTTSTGPDMIWDKVQVSATEIDP